MSETTLTPTHKPAAGTVRRLSIGKLTFYLAVGFLLALVAVAAAAPWVSPYDPLSQNLTAMLAPPSAEHLLGTDQLGRDTLSRLIWGARPAMLGVVITVVTACLLGIPWGLVAGYVGGLVDQMLMRAVDALLVFPGIILCLVLASVFGPSLQSSMVALGMVYSPVLARVARSGVLTVRNREFVLITELYGYGRWYRMWNHVLPNALAPIVVQVTLLAGMSLLAQVGLGFLGVGIQPPYASWGGSLADAFQFIVVQPSATYAAGILVVLVVLCLYRIGDELRDRLSLSA